MFYNLSFKCLIITAVWYRPECDVGTGKCQCKENVEGQRCQKCKPGHFQVTLIWF